MKKCFLLIIIAVVFFGCATATINKSSSADFSKYKKVTIVDVTNNVGSNTFGKALEGELMSRGVQLVDKYDSSNYADVIIEVSYSYIFTARIIKTGSNELVAIIQSTGPSDSFTGPDVVSRTTARKIGALFSQ